MEAVRMQQSSKKVSQIVGLNLLGQGQVR